MASRANKYCFHSEQEDIPADGASYVLNNSRVGRSWWATAEAYTSCGRSPSCPLYAF